MKKPLRLVLIYGSVRSGRFCDTVAQWAIGEIGQLSDLTLDVVDPSDRWPAIETALLRRQIGDADAVVVVTPEYNHSYPGPVKMFIDSVREEWQAKPVGFISYGGISGGLRAIEHLRHVFIELHAVPIRDSVSFQNAWEVFGEDGKPRNGNGHTQALKTMLARLNWWARALKAGREAQAYGEAA